MVALRNLQGLEKVPWYWRISASADLDRLGRAEPMDWKAELLGAKIVTSRRESTVSMSSVRVRAPAIPLRPAAMAVFETGSGMVKTVSMI